MQSENQDNLLLKKSDYSCILVIILDLLSEIVALREEIDNLIDSTIACIDSEADVLDELFNQIMNLGNATPTLNEKERLKLHELFGV